MGKSMASIAVALIVGVAIGFVAGRAGRAPVPEATKPTVAEPTKPPEKQPPAKPMVAEAQYYNVPFDPAQPTKGPADAKVTIIEVSDFQ